MTEELTVNRRAFNGDQGDYDSIREAIKRLSSASQDQFDEIKKEKWYNRVFDMLTFSQNGKKRLAEQVGTLAQAQQIFVELLLRLSENDSSIAKIVVDSMDDIRRIQEQNIYLLERIKRLEDTALGIRTDMDLNRLSDSQKKVLCGCLYYLGNRTERPSKWQQKYANSVIRYINVNVQMENPLANLDDMPTESKKRILTSCMEYIFLKDCTDKNYPEYEDFISEFDLGNKSMKTIEGQITSLYKLRGPDGFCDKYQEENFEQIDDNFTIDFDKEEKNDKETNEESNEDADTGDIIANIVFNCLGSDHSCVTYTGNIPLKVREDAKKNIVDHKDIIDPFFKAGKILTRRRGDIFFLPRGLFNDLLSVGEIVRDNKKSKPAVTCDVEDIVAVVDSSKSGNCKEGIVFTRDGVFFSQTGDVSQYIPYEDMLSVSGLEGKLQVKRYSGDNFTWKTSQIPKNKVALILGEIKKSLLNVKDAPHS